MTRNYEIMAVSVSVKFMHEWMNNFFLMKLNNVIQCECEIHAWMNEFFVFNEVKCYTVEPRYKEVGYNKSILLQGIFAGPTSLYFFCFFTLI